jgi:hypothetical protein
MDSLIPMESSYSTLNQRQICEVCLGLDHTSTRWRVVVRDDLTIEYTLEFKFPELTLAADRGCPICSIIHKGLELMSSALLLSDHTQTYRQGGRFILQNDSPIELELDGCRSSRIQYYTDEGVLVIFEANFYNILPRLIFGYGSENRRRSCSHAIDRVGRIEEN